MKDSNILEKINTNINNENILQNADNDERPTENMNNDIRYTEVDNDFMSNSNPIEGYDQNNVNIIGNNGQEQNEEKKVDDTIHTNKIQSKLYNDKRQIYTYKIIVLGDIAVGKTSVISRYITNTFKEEHVSTINCEYKQKRVDIDGDTACDLQIWDTAGEERFMAVTRQYYKDSQGAIIIYDLTKKESFDKIKKWIEELKNNAPKNIVIMILGNKADLTSNKVDLGNELTPYKNEYLYCEVSAKNGTNVSMAFENMAIKIVENEKTKKEKGDTTPPRVSVALKKVGKKEPESKCKC